MDNNKMELLQIRNIISKGWQGMLMLLFLMQLTDVVECGMKNDFSFLIKDPGTKGLWFITIIAIVNLITQISIQTFECRSFRWFVFGLTILYALFFVGHQVIHLANGEGADFHFFLDIAHHIFGIWASIFAYKWAKSKIEF